jgi:predicted RNA-binding Zn-ribbon protein involved in translation (DUF1610 family)
MRGISGHCTSCGFELHMKWGTMPPNCPRCGNQMRRFRRGKGDRMTKALRVVAVLLGVGIFCAVISGWLCALDVVTGIVWGVCIWELLRRA